jgi:hypothetical protein
MPFKTTSTVTSNTTSGMLLPWFYCWPLYNICTGIKSTTSGRLCCPLWTSCQQYCCKFCWQLVHSGQHNLVHACQYHPGTNCWFSQILRVYCCVFYYRFRNHHILKIILTLESMTVCFYILLYSIYHIGCRCSR